MSIDRSADFVQSEKKREYRTKSDEWQRDNGWLFKTLFFFLSPEEPVPIRGGDDIRLSIGKSVFPVHSGDNRISTTGVTGEPLMIANERISYVLMTLGDSRHITIRIGPGADLLIYSSDRG